MLWARFASMGERPVSRRYQKSLALSRLAPYGGHGREGDPDVCLSEPAYDQLVEHFLPPHRPQRRRDPGKRVGGPPPQKSAAMIWPM